MMDAGARPPGPEPLGRNPIALYRFFKQISADPIGFVGARFQRYGDVYFTVSRGDDLYVLKHPDHLHEVLVTKASSFSKRDQDLEPVLGRGLLTSNGDLWRRQRRLIQPAFQKNKIDAYGTAMVDAAERMLERWRPEQRIDLAGAMMKLTLDIVAKTLFDHDVAGESDVVADAMSVLQDSAANNVIPPWIPTPGNLRARRALSALDRIVFGMIDRVEGISRDDLLARLFRAADDEGTMSRKQLRDELVTLFLAGHETTSLALTWTFYLLSKNPEQRERLHQEIDRVLGQRRATPEDLEEMPFTAKVVDEALRLFPPAYVLPRICREETEVGGYRIPKDAELVLWIWHCHHDARWFPEPERFDPDRFEQGRVLHPHAYLPFGAGSRTCIGKTFATLEARILLVTIAQRFRVDVDPSRQVALNARVTLGPRGGMPVTLSHR
jgi:cytochrome P450